MRVLMIVDALFAQRERSMLARLTLGLASEGHAVIHALPEDMPSDLRANGLSNVVASTLIHSPVHVPILRDLAARTLADRVRKLDEQAGENTTIVHAFGGTTWHLARAVANELGTGLVLEIWRCGLLDRLRDMHQLPAKRTALLLATPAQRDRAVKVLGAGVHAVVAPWGVLTGEPHPVLRGDRAASLMLVGTGRDEQAFAACLRGLAPFLRQRDDVLVFCDALAARRADLWKLARSIDKDLVVRSRISLIDDIESRPDLLMSGDLLLHPETSGEQRGIILEAFARGVVVLAGNDPQSDSLIEGQTARLIDPPKDPGAWERVVRETLESPHRAMALAANAHEFVRSQRKASDQLARVLDAYDLIANPRPHDA